MRIAALALCAIVAGCVTAETTFTPDGRQGHVLSCTPAWTGGLVGGIASASTNWGTCYQKAGEICGARGYDILEKTGEHGQRIDGSRDGISARTETNRLMVVRCKGDAPQPQIKKVK